MLVTRRFCVIHLYTETKVNITSLSIQTFNEPMQILKNNYEANLLLEYI